MLCEKQTSGRHCAKLVDDRVDASLFDAERDVRARAQAGLCGLAPPVQYTSATW